MTGSLREQLLGAWILVSYVERPVEGGADLHPMGREPRGIILYTHDGYMSAQLMAPGRPEFASGDWSTGSDEEFRAESSGYIAYSGPFHVDEERGALTHTMSVSLYPNWIGQTQPRVVHLDGDMLHLSTASPIRSGGRLVHAHVTWRRSAKG